MKTRFFLILLLLLSAGLVQADPLGTAFTYQGELKQLGVAANGAFDFQFEMYDAESAGALVTTTVLLEDVTVSDGIFTVELDFGSRPFTGDKLWLEVAVREGASAGGYTSLLPRQQITPAPYTLRAMSVAPNSVGSTEVDSSKVQLRVDESCGGFSAIASIAADGTVSCENSLLPKGGNLNCSDNQKMTGLAGSTGDVICDNDIDTNTNAGTICPNGYFLNGDGTCDLADGTGDCSAGRVCTGGHGHTNYVPKISDDAVITTGDYTHSIRNGYIHVPGSTFASSSSSNEFAKIPFSVSPTGGSTSYSGYASIDLPDGAIVKSITGYYYDNETGGAAQTYTCELRTRASTSGNWAYVAQQTSTVNWVASGSVRAMTSPGVSHVVDKGLKAYMVYMRIAGTNGTTNFRHYGCRVNYTYNNTNK